MCETEAINTDQLDLNIQDRDIILKVQVLVNDDIKKGEVKRRKEDKDG